MKTKYFSLAVLFLSVLFCVVSACTTQPLNTSPSASPAGQATIVKKLSPQEAYKLVQSRKNAPDFVILDVRTPEEFESGHIEGAININYHSETFVEELNKLDKAKAYLVYCRTGRRSGDTVDVMTRQGFRELYRFNGDILKWKSERLPVVKGTK